jgi:FimV-like protein
VKSAQKIDKLERESESLRKRLDALLAEKSASDNKLTQLENSLQAALKKTTAVAGTVAMVTSKDTEDSDKKESTKEPEQKSVVTDKALEQQTQAISESEKITQRANENLRETNGLLEKNLQESKKDIAERTRESLAKEHAIKAEQAASNVASSSETFDTSNKYLQWALLSLLLLIWFAKRFISAKKPKKQPAWATESNSQSGVLGGLGNKKIETHYQEAPVESSIKLDVASAYLESGNTDEAMEILNEILLEGSAEQKAQAQDLLNRYS